MLRREQCQRLARASQHCQLPGSPDELLQLPLRNYRHLQLHAGDAYAGAPHGRLRSCFRSLGQVSRRSYRSRWHLLSYFTGKPELISIFDFNVKPEKPF